MTLAQPLPDLRKALRQLFIDGQLPTALITLDELLPDPSEKKAAVAALRADFNQLNKDQFRGVIDPEEHAKRLAQINARFNDLLDALTEADFEPPAVAADPNRPAGPKTGSVLYKIPRQMPIQKPTTCTIRVAVDEEAILDDIVLDDAVRLRQRVEVSDQMSAELVDVSGKAFEVVALSAARQKVRDTGYTQWVFRVTPLIEGEHELMVKVSLMEFDENTKEYVPREVSVLEKVTVVTEAPAPSDSDDTPLRAAGLQINLEGANSKGQEANSKGQPAEMSPPSPEATAGKSAEPLQTSNSQTSNYNRPLRAMALFLAFVMLGSATTWAATPPAIRDWWAASVRDNPEAYAAYIEKYRASDPNNPRLEKAYFRLADKTNALADLRHYQDRYPLGIYIQEVREKIAQLEAAALADLQKQPESAKIYQFLANFPDADHLPEVKQLAEQLLPGQRAALIPALEIGYVRTMQLHPSLPKFEQYLRDFPQLGRLADMAETVCPLSAALPALQSTLDKVIEEKVQAATLPAEVQALLPALQAGGSPQAAERVEQILAKKPAPLRQQLAAEVQRVRVQVEQRQCALQLAPGTVPTVAPQVSNTAQSPDTVVPLPPAGTQPSGNAPANTSTSPATSHNAPDSDGDGTPDSADGCPTDKGKTAPGICGCGHPDSDADGDGTPDCHDQCPNEKGAAIDKGCPPPAAPPTVSRKSGLNMVRIAAGSFTMGSPETQQERGKDECPHPVTVIGFSIGQYEVTQADWREVMGGDPPSLYNKGCDDCPVENVSWNDVQKFLNTLNKAPNGKKYRLPTEEEWEYAARGGSQSRNYEYAGSDRPDEVAWFMHNYKAGNSFGTQKTTRPVGIKKPNELGLYDMSGNVWEWCSDQYKAYPGCESAFEEGKFPVLRGGSWQDENPDCRSAQRFSGGGAAIRTRNVGFRLVLAQ